MNGMDLLSILLEHLSTESKWLLVTLKQSNGPLNKEQLRDAANSFYLENQFSKGIKQPEALIKSRHLLDIHTARLEGAGLVSVKEVGRIRIYSMTQLGEILLEYASKNN